MAAALAGTRAARVRAGDGQALALLVKSGEAVELAGYRWLTPEISPGETAARLTIWRVLDPAAVGPRVPPAFETDTALFVPVLDASGAIVARQDRLDAPSWDWQAGDAIAQLFRLTIPQDLPAGEYAAEAGIYNRSDGARLAGADSRGSTVDDSVVLEALTIALR